MPNMTELDGQQVGTSPVANVNELNSANNQGLNTFDLSRYKAFTSRFADVTPFLCLETVPRDSIRYSNNHELRTLTLKSPLLSPVRMHKSYFHVPLKAIMPNTWELVIRNPKFGDDIPDSLLPKANLVSLCYNVANGASAFLKVNFIDATAPLTKLDLNFFKGLVFLRNLFGKGTLLRYLGFSVPKPVDLPEFDVQFDLLVAAIFSSSSYTSPSSLNLSVSLPSNTEVYSLTVSSSNAPSSHGSRSVEQFLDSIEYGDVVLTNNSIGNFSAKLKAYFSSFAEYLARYSNALVSAQSYRDSFVNLCPLFAYQMTLAQFYSNDNVDNVDSSIRWLENMRSLVGVPSSVIVNGVSYIPDLPCQSRMTYFINFAQAFLTDVTDSSSQNLRSFWLNLLCYGRSLKYGDYFLGSRTRPLAVGDVEILVNNNGQNYVSAVDVTRGVAVQRFLNAVNKLSQSIAQYTKGIFGVATGAIDPMPQFVSRSTTYIGNPETINTAENQGRITSQLTSVDGKYEFTAQFSDFGYLIGLISCDVIPCYPNLMERYAYHRDRYEFFNPMLQNIGDQEVRLSEVSSIPSAYDSTFGYQQRYAEYKQGVSSCLGAFSLETTDLDYADSLGLSSWIYQSQTPNGPIHDTFVRHQRVDFDRFYSSLGGYSLSTYVHFAIVLNQQITANRAMQYISTIL